MLLLEPKIIPQHWLQEQVEPKIIPRLWIQEQNIQRNHQMWHQIKDIGRTWLQVIHCKKIQFIEEEILNLMDLNLFIQYQIIPLLRVRMMKKTLKITNWCMNYLTKTNKTRKIQNKGRHFSKIWWKCISKIISSGIYWQI